jgi:hypothetical protein
VGAFVHYVGEVLGRAHSLFGDPPESGGSAAAGASNTVGGAGNVVRTAGGTVDALSGGFAASYGDFAGRAGPALDGLAGLDSSFGGVLTDAAATDRTGRGQSAAVVNGAAADTDVLAPWSGTPAGQKVLLTQLRGRLAQQQQVIAAYKARDARMAALLRSMAYRSRPGGGGMPLRPPNFGGGSDRGCFACTLGGPDGTTLFMVAAEWRGITEPEPVSPGTGQVLSSEVDVPGAGWP